MPLEIWGGEGGRFSMAGNKKDSGFVLQARDRQLLNEIAHMRLVDREMAKVVAGFRSTTRANTRLLKLTRAGLLKRFFVGTIGAGRKAIYSLAPSAASLVDSPLRLVRQPRGTTVFGEQFVGHQLALNQVDLAFARHQRPSLVETFRWRTVLKSVSSSLRLIPDAYTEWTAAQSGRAAFIEVDLGTETLKRWREKVRMYLQFATSGELASTFGHQRFRVLVITNSERRLNNIRRTVLRQTDKIFWFATLESINREGIWSPIWLRPAGEQLLSLA